MKALPNDRITDVTVEAITRGGHVLDQLVTSGGTADTTLTFAAALSARGLLVGDILRNGDEYRAVDSVTGNAVTIDKTMGTLTGAKIFKQNGMKYDITFEQGCRTHEDCRYNGVDENDSDGPAQKVLYEGGDNNAAYCHDGGTCMCTDGFYGPGCTATGRGHHANNKVTVSGDVYNLKCDGTVKQENGVTQGLTASQSAFFLTSVTRVDPLKVTLSSDTSSAIVVGDHIRIENQVRTVVSSTASGTDPTVLYVDRPFEEIDTSDITKIFPQYTPVEVIADMGGVRSSCTVTDLRQLTSTEEICRYAPGTDRDVRACGHFTANQGILSGRDDQVMREINPAHNIATSDIVVTIIKDVAPSRTGSQFTYNAADDTEIIGVKVGMAVGFKIRTDSVNAPTTFTAQGIVTQFDGAARTFTVSALSSTTAFEAGEWNAADCTTPADCCATGTTACQIKFTQAAEVAELMDEREVEIGDRIRILTSLGSWETRTVDSVTYTTGYQVSGFVVSEPYENTVSTTANTANTVTITTNNAIGATNSVCLNSDFCKVTGATKTSSDGVYKVDSVAGTTTTFYPAYGLPGQNVQQVYTLTKAHLAYNDGAGTTEAKSCSGRGLCDDSSGECQCFKGYTGVDCSIQNALAV